jgi:hypothetical protein
VSADDADRKTPRYRFGRPAPEYRHQFEAITQEMHGVYTPPDSPEMPRVRAAQAAMYQDLYGQFTQIKASPRPGLIDALIQ